jgi:hypothetical protein
MVFLDELMQAKDFRSAVDGLARDFRRKFAFPAIHQLGVAVPDVEKAAYDLEAKGIGPFFIAGGSTDLWNERYEPRSFRGKMAIAYHHGFEVELLEPGEGSDFYARSVDPNGRPVVQHLGFLVQDVDVWASILSQAGFPVYVRGRLSATPLIRTNFAYMDTEAETGLVLEFICWKLLGIPLEPVPAVMHGIGALQKLSGKRVLYL